MIRRLFTALLALFTGSESAQEAATKKHNVNLDWMLPSSEAAKRELIGKEWGALFGDQNYDYLWYELGHIDSLTSDETKSIIAASFVNGGNNFGDVELHHSRAVPGRPSILRLRGKLRLLPAIKLRGRYCPLYQIGYGDFMGVPTEGCINFHTHWNRKEKLTTNHAPTQATT